MANLLDALKASLSSSRPADSLAAPGSVAGTIKARRDAPMAAADSDDPQATMARLVRQQHTDHAN